MIKQAYQAYFSIFFQNFTIYAWVIPLNDKQAKNNRCIKKLKKSIKKRDRKIYEKDIPRFPQKKLYKSIQLILI